MNETQKKIELFVRDFFKIQLVVNPLRKNITFPFNEVQFLLFERIPHKNSLILFLFRSFERSELQAHVNINRPAAPP